MVILDKIREQYQGAMRKRLKKESFTLISQNCVGGGCFTIY